MSKLIDLKNKKFGRLTVIEKCDSRYVNGEVLWKCQCSCEKKTIIYSHGSQLRAGHKKSCGCLWKPGEKEFINRMQTKLINHSKQVGQCIEWTGFKDKNGYGKTTITKNGIERPIGVHRLSWMVYRGNIPSGMFVCHHCDNPSCIRIEHLFLGTSQDNINDKMKKGRGNKKWGEHCKRSKLKEFEVIDILKSKGKFSSTDLSKKYNITPMAIRSIWQRKNWKHVRIEE